MEYNKVFLPIKKGGYIMTKMMKKLLSMLLILTLAIASLTGCGTKKDEKDTTTPTVAPTVTENEGPKDDGSGTDATEPTETPTPEPDRDLNELEIIIGNWWAPSSPAEPTTTYEEDLLAYREEIQAKYNFTIKEVNIGGWGEIQELYSTTVNAGDPVASIFVLDSSFVPALLNAGLFYPVSELEAFDFADEKWNSLVHEAMTFNGVTYGFATGYEPRTGVFFNKRLFEEAGLDPETPYNLQASGKWTWDEFKKLCQQLTYDKDNDGVMDTYALASFSKDFFPACAISNGANLVGKDENGYFYNATGDPKFLEALQWGRSLYDEGYVMPKAEDAEWNYFVAAFHDGQVAMRVAEEYNKVSLADMEDDWGFVMFPSSTEGELTAIYRENVLVIPSSYDKQTAEDIAFAYNLYTEPLPGYEDEESWKLASYSAYRDARAVDETLAIMRSGKGAMLLSAYVYGLEIGDIVYGLDAGEKTPAEAIESAKQSWDALITDANGAIK